MNNGCDFRERCGKIITYCSCEGTVTEKVQKWSVKDYSGLIVNNLGCIALNIYYKREN